MLVNQELENNEHHCLFVSLDTIVWFPVKSTLWITFATNKKFEYVSNTSCVYIYIYICVCVCKWIYIYICIYIYIYILWHTSTSTPSSGAAATAPGGKGVRGRRIIGSAILQLLRVIVVCAVTVIIWICKNCSHYDCYKEDPPSVSADETDRFAHHRSLAIFEKPLRTWSQRVSVRANEPNNACWDVPHVGVSINGGTPKWMNQGYPLAMAHRNGL